MFRKLRNRPAALSARPAVEALEDRLVPSTFLVTNSSDNSLPGSLRYAIGQANQPGNAGSVVSITAQVNGPIILSHGELSVSADMTISNDSGAPVEIRQATPNARVLHVLSGASTVTLTGNGDASPLTLDGGSVTGDNGGGILVGETTNLSLTDVRVVSNSVAAARKGQREDGGGIYAAGGTITLTDSSVSNNAAPDGTGGGIKVEAGSVVLNGSHVDGNSAHNVGGIDVVNVANRGDTAVQVLAGSTVNGNSSTATVNPITGDFGSGGIAADGAGGVYVSASQVSHNRTVGMYSGGIVVGVGDVMVTDGSQIDDNTNRGPGGGIAANFHSTVTVSGGSEVNGNTGAAIGGGIVNFSALKGGVVITGGSHVDGNVLTNEETLGQAIAVFLIYIKTHQSLDAGASAAAARAAQDLLKHPDRLVVGGGIGTLAAPITVMDGSEVNGNFCGRRDVKMATTGLGGGIFSLLGSVTVDQSAVSYNLAPFGDGGGIYNAFNLLTLTCANISNNRASGDGGGIWNGGILSCDDTTVANNTAGGDGGGLFNAGLALVVDSAFTGNTAGGHGGGIATPGVLVPINLTFADNTPDNISRK
jgi:fibronectin-binding autotransporter adhesin